MTKPKKREPLVVGQRVWLEELPWYHSRDDKRSVREYEVVKSNGASAYVIRVEDLEKAKRGERVSENRINQKTYHASNSVSRFNVWLTKEEFEQNVQYNNDLKTMRQQAHAAVDKMNLSQLKALFGE